MRSDRTTPTIWIMTAVVGGVLVALGGIVTTTSAVPRLAILGGAIAVAALGIYAAVATRRNHSLSEEADQLRLEIDALHTADASLRTRMAYTLRDPLTSIVGFADRMVDEPGLAFDEQREMLIAIRTDAQEVEHALSDLAEAQSGSTDDPSIEAVVLLDQEIISIASTITTDAILESDLAHSRAWGDSAKVRQILRTVLNAATDSGCAFITLRTEQGADRATVAISGRDDLLSIEAAAALTGNTVSEDLHSDDYRALRSAYELAASMRGSIGYVQAFGISHIVVDLPAAPTDLGITVPRLKPDQPFEISFAAVSDLRPERPTSAIRFA